MRRLLFLVIGVVVAGGGVFLTALAARGEECSLQLKRLQATTRYVPSEYQFRATSQQSVHTQFQDSSTGRVRVEVGGAQDAQAAFKRIVKKEPAKYDCRHPFRGVVKLGNQEFAFVFDAVGAKADEAEEAAAKAKAAKEKEKKEKEKKEKAKKSSLLESLSRAMTTEEDAAGQSSREPGNAIRYNRFYFDRNHNGDLTDDPVIASDRRNEMTFSSGQYARVLFPLVTVPLEVDGSKYEYAFTVNATYQSMGDRMAYVWAGFQSASYREGEIVLEGKKRQVALIDFNSNGRFDDVITLRDGARGRDGEIYPNYGDMFLLDPQAASSMYSSPYDVTTSGNRYNVAKLVAIDGKFYDLAISPAGDKLSLKPATPSVGYVTNPSESFTALVYGDQGFLKISGGKSKPAALPVGSWRLLNCTIDRTAVEEAKKPDAEKEKPAADKDDKAAQKAQKSLDLLAAVAKALIGGASASSPAAPFRATVVSARATYNYKPVEVRKGQTVVLPFGPPYKAVVQVAYSPGPGQVRLEMTLVGCAGERCSNMMVHGSRPAKPEFTISNPKGEVVYRGSFEYG